MLLGLGLVLVVLADILGFLSRGRGPVVRSRYDCLIMRSLSGKEDVVSSSGFPAYQSAQEALEGVKSMTPAAAREAQLLGTQVRIAAYDMDMDRAEAAVAAGLDRIAQLSAKLNIFDPDSAVSRINRTAHREPVEIDEDVARLLRLSLRVASLSDGAFDVTVGPLTSLWRRYRHEGKLPPVEEVVRARDRVGYRKIEWTDASAVRFTREGMSLDFGGIAKGFAADEAAVVLWQHGVRSAIIDCGGDLKLIGSRPGGRPFRVGVDEPRLDDPSRLRFVLSLSNMSVVTSGNYRQFTMINGKCYSHIIDPRTGQSIEALPSVTVIGPDSGMCDALATAISVLGEEEGLKLIEKVNAESAGEKGSDPFARKGG